MVFVPEENISKEQLLKKNDVLLAMSSGSRDLVGKAAQAEKDFNAAFGAFCGVYRPSSEIDGKYVGLFFQSLSYRQIIRSFSSGIGINNLRREHIENMPFPLAPLEEQRRIVGKIDELLTDLDTGVQTLIKSRTLIIKYRQSVLKSAFEGKITEEWRKRNPNKLESANTLRERLNTRLTKDSQKFQPIHSLNLIELPNTWLWARVGETISIIDYRGRTPPFSEEGIPHLRSANIRNGKIVMENMRYVSQETYRSYMTRGLPQKGDLIFTTEAPMGEVTQIPEFKFSLAQRTMLLRPSELFNPKFLQYQLMSVAFQGRLKGKGTGTTVSGVSSRNFKPIPLALTSLAEQTRIVEEIEKRFSIADSAEMIVDAGLKQATRLRQSILKKAFEGRLVQQDPNDQPAQKLLERISAQKAKAEVSNNKVFKKKVSK